MKKLCVFFLGIILVISTAGSACAKEAKTIAILPFAVHSAENIDYIRDGIWDMLRSRLSGSDNVNVLTKDSVTKARGKLGGKDLSVADVYSIGKKLDADFVVWGSITKIGSSISLDGKLLDVGAYTSPLGVFEQCRGMDDVIPKISNFAKKITYQLSGQVPPAVELPSPEPTPAATQPQESGTAVPQDEKAIETLRTPEGTYTAIINPEFINAARPLDRKGFWMTRRYSMEFKGLDIGDVDKDGLNEVVIIDGTGVFIYRKTGKTLEQVGRVPGNDYDVNLSVDVADINGNGIDEIIVTCLKGNSLSSFVIEYRDGKYAKIASDLPWFLRVIDVSGKPILLGQRRGIDKPFENPIYEIVWKDGTYADGVRMYIPEGLSVYGVTMDSIDGSATERVIAFDEYDHLYIYEKTKKPLSKIHIFGGSDEIIWKSEGAFGGSNSYVDFSGQERAKPKTDAESENKAFINVRILTYDINRDGKKEIIVVKNLSGTGRMLKNFKAFTKSEIYDLEWDGLGLLENWKTREINGYVADYQFKDIDNDGKNEIVLALVMSVGGVIKPKSVVVAYDLKIQ